ncbi:hypothetical protein H0H92_010439, partial [Tricholoma furcatifolium]
FSEFTNVDVVSDPPDFDADLRVVNNSASYNEGNSVLNPEQHETVNYARASLDDEQRRMIDDRMQMMREVNMIESAVETVESNSSSDKQEGPSQNKGKGPDPENWGAMEFDEDEIDPEIQQRILEACNNILRESKNKNDNKENEPPMEEMDSSDNDEQESNEEMTREELKEKLKLQSRILKEFQKREKKLKKGPKKERARRAASEPLSKELEDMIGKLTNVNKKISARRLKDENKQTNQLNLINQITKDSALGWAFERMRKDDGPPTRQTKANQNRRMVLIVTPDRPMCRQEDLNIVDMVEIEVDMVVEDVLVEKFMQFLTHGTAYVKYGRVERRRRVMVLSQHLEGKAWTYYSREV